MPSNTDRLELRLDLPGLPEMEPLLRDFATRAIEFADIEEDRKIDLLEAMISAVSLVERELDATEHEAVTLQITAIIDSAAIEFSVLESGTPLGDDDLNASGEGDITLVELQAVVERQGLGEDVPTFEKRQAWSRR